MKVQDIRKIKGQKKLERETRKGGGTEKDEKRKRHKLSDNNPSRHVLKRRLQKQISRNKVYKVQNI